MCGPLWHRRGLTRMFSLHLGSVVSGAGWSKLVLLVPSARREPEKSLAKSPKWRRFVETTAALTVLWPKTLLISLSGGEHAQKDWVHADMVLPVATGACCSRCMTVLGLTSTASSGMKVKAKGYLWWCCLLVP